MSDESDGGAASPHASTHPARAGRGYRGRSSRLPRLLARARERYPLCEVSVPLVGAPAPFHVTLPADPDAPLDAMAARLRTLKAANDAPPIEGNPTYGSATQDAAASATRMLATGAHLPYWALLWPSGQALAEAVLARPEMLAGRRVLELGCGLGVTAAAALAAGADLWAADGFPEALLFAAINCLRNAGQRPRPLLLNWRTEAGRTACRALAPFDLVLAADVLYEPEDEAPLLDLVPALLAPGGAFWLAEPGRRVSREFVERAWAAGWREEASTLTRAWPPDGDTVSVGIHRFTMPDGGVH